MKISTSIELVWQLAAREAIAGEFQEIEPDHFFMALLKFSELPTGELDKIAPGDQTAKTLSDECGVLREILTARGIAGTTVRRKLRSLLGKGNNPYPGGKMHRSDASRRLFDAAARIAFDIHSDVLTTKQLLEAILLSPTPAVAQFLGGDTGPQGTERAGTPLLRKYGVDLAQQGFKKRPSDLSDRKVEALALVRTLIQTNRPCVFLVNESDAVTLSIAEATAQLMAGSSCPPELKGMKIVDVSSIIPKHVTYLLPALISEIKEVLAEAATLKNVILYGLPIMIAPGSGGSDEVARLLKELLQTGTVKCVFQVSPLDYHTWLQKDSVWRKLAEVMWIHNRERNEIPTEL